MKEESNREVLYREELPRLKAAPMCVPAKFPPELHPENRTVFCRLYRLLHGGHMHRSRPGTGQSGRPQTDRQMRAGQVGDAGT